MTAQKNIKRKSRTIEQVSAAILALIGDTQVSEVNQSDLWRLVTEEFSASEARKCGFDQQNVYEFLRCR